MKILIILFFTFSIFGCAKNDIELDTNEKGYIKISDSENNRYLGCAKLINEQNDNLNEIYVYEKYIAEQMLFEDYNVGVAIYNNNKNYNKYKNQKEIYKTHEYKFIGIYDNYLFLLVIGKSPTYTILKIINLNVNEIIYEGDYVWDIGIKFTEPYIIEIYEYNNIIDTKIENGGNIYKFIFDKYLLNIKTKEKINLNKQIEITGL